MRKSAFFLSRSIALRRRTSSSGSVRSTVGSGTSGRGSTGLWFAVMVVTAPSRAAVQRTHTAPYLQRRSARGGRRSSVREITGRFQVCVRVGPGSQDVRVARAAEAELLVVRLDHVGRRE